VNNRLLVTYATRAGSTAGIAATIAATLRQRGFLVTVKPVRENPVVKGYQAVILGSAIRQGNWLPEAVTFLMANREPLRRVRVALFTVHLLNLGNDETSRLNREAYLTPLRSVVSPVAHVFFPGKIDPERLSVIDRLTVAVTRKPIGDFRDWDKIGGWAKNVFSEELDR